MTVFVYRVDYCEQWRSWVADPTYGSETMPSQKLGNIFTGFGSVLELDII